MPHRGDERLEEPPDRGADERPDDHARAEDPARPAGADGQARGDDAGEGEDQHDPQRHRGQLGAEAVLDPSITGAKHFGDGERGRSHQDATDGRVGPSR